MTYTKGFGGLPDADGDAVDGLKHPARTEMGFFQGSDRLGMLVDVQRLPRGRAAIVNVSVGTSVTPVVPASDGTRISVTVENPSDQRIYIGSVAGGRGPVVGMKPWIEPGDAMIDDTTDNDWTAVVEVGTVTLTYILTTLPVMWTGLD